MNYTMPQNTKGFLLPEEVSFFYYDIMRDTEDSIQLIYDWNSDIQKFLNDKGVIVDTKETLPDKIMKDEVYFTIGEKDEENKAVAFFRHLRNAFTHFRIVHEGEYLRLEDKNMKKKTMVGLIKYNVLKEFCFLFFNQRTNFIEKLESLDG